MESDRSFSHNKIMSSEVMMRQVWQLMMTLLLQDIGWQEQISSFSRGKPTDPRNLVCDHHQFRLF